MEDQIELFGKLCEEPSLAASAFVLILNQTDLFKKKIQNVPITVCPLLSHFEGDTTSYEETSIFIKEQFEARNSSHDRIFTHFTCAIDTPSVMKTLGLIQKPIIDAAMTQKGELMT